MKPELTARSSVRTRLAVELATGAGVNEDIAALGALSARFKAEMPVVEEYLQAFIVGEPRLVQRV